MDDRWSPRCRFIVDDHPLVFDTGWADPYQQLAGDGVAAAELGGAIRTDVAGGDRGRDVEQVGCGIAPCTALC